MPVGPLEPHFRGQGAKSVSYATEEELKPLNNTFFLSESVESLSRTRDWNMTQNEHAYAICYRPEAVGDVISGEM